MLFPTYAGLVALLVAGPLDSAPPRDRLRLALDDPTIVAIFDAANTYDVEASDLRPVPGDSPSSRSSRQDSF